MFSSRHMLRSFLMVVLTVSVLHNAYAVEDEVESPSSSPEPSSLVDKVSGVMHSVKQQADETLVGSPMLNRLQTTGPKWSEGGVARNTENRLVKDDALGRLQETKGRTMAAAKKVMDETILKMQTTVEDIKRTVSGDDREDSGGDRRISYALDSLFRAVGSESKAAFQYASDVINETADRAKAAVERAQHQKQRTRPLK